MTRCGICHCRYSKETPLLCSGCTNFQLLRPKLDYIQVIQELDTYKSAVDHVLEHCIKGQNYPFIKDYISNGSNQTDKLTSGKNNEIEISIDSIAALSSQLLTIDSMLMKRRNNKILKEISILKSKQSSKTMRLEALRESRDSKLNSLKSFKQSNDNALKQTTNPIKLETSQKIEDVNGLKKQINVSQSILFKDLINLYMIKKRKLSGTSQFIYLISFIPVISTQNIILFNHEIINTSLLQISRFIHQISQIWFINLPFKFEFPKNLYYNVPQILNFKLSLPEDQQIWEISTFELKLFLNGVSRLIMNIYTILKYFQLDNEMTHYKQLLKIDEMIYKIVNNSHEFSERRNNNNNMRTQQVDSDEEKEQIDEQDLQIKDNIDIDDLTSLIYKIIMSKINKKNNEWHVVKKEFLIDEE